MKASVRKEIVATLIKQGRRDLAQQFVGAAGGTFQDKLDAAHEEYWKELIPKLEKSTFKAQWGPFKKGKFTADKSGLRFDLITNEGQKVTGGAFIRNGKLMVHAVGLSKTDFKWSGAHHHSPDNIVTYVVRVADYAAKGDKLSGEA